MSEQIIDVANAIRAERYADAAAVFAAGSIVGGQGTPFSDLDLVVVYAQLPCAYRESFISAGYPVEAFVHDPATLEYFFLEIDRRSGVPVLPQMVIEGIEIPGPNELSQQLKRRATEVIKAGPPPLDDDSERRLRYAVSDLLDDLRAPRSRDEQIEVRHLVGLVDDLLDVSRITRGRIELRKERLDLAEVVGRAVEIASPVLEQQRHYLDIDVPRGLPIDGDAGRLAQVVANLLTNAAKYTEAAGRITVSGREHGTEVVLTVRDTGIGIDEDMLPRIFDLFVQEPQTLARSQGGLGLGLAIVRSLVEQHGGTVAAASAGKGHGAEFTVRLPRPNATDHPRASETLRAAAASVRPAAGTRVIIVDDNEDAAALLGVLVGEFGYDTRVVHDGPTAIAEAERFDPQLALVDLGLSVMDGFELALRFAEHPRLRETKLIAVTGYGQARDRETSARAGFAAHLVKPVDLDELRAILGAVAKRETSAPSFTSPESP